MDRNLVQRWAFISAFADAETFFQNPELFEVLERWLADRAIQQALAENAAPSMVHGLQAAVQVFRLERIWIVLRSLFGSLRQRNFLKHNPRQRLSK